MGGIYCAHVVSFDEMTSIALLEDADDRLCYAYTPGERKLGRTPCSDPTALRFRWEDPTMYAAGIVEDWCLEGWRDEALNLWPCTPGKARMEFLPHYEGHYLFPCLTTPAGNTQATQCGCKTQDNPILTTNHLQSYQSCLSGRIRGATGARTLTSMRPESLCNGQPAPLQSISDPDDPNTMYVHWAEDTPDYTTAATKIAKVVFHDDSVEVTAEFSVSGCVHGGNIIWGRSGVLAVLCGAYNPQWVDNFDLSIVEISRDLTSELRRFTVLPDDVVANAGEGEGKYPMQGGADFRLLSYAAHRNWYIAFYNSGSGSQMADEMRVLDADTTHEVPNQGSAFQCQNGQTQSGRMVYNPELDQLAALCSSDTGGLCTDPTDPQQACDADHLYSNGMTLRTHISNPIGPITLAPFNTVYDKAISGWLGDIVPCSDGYAVAWVGADGVGNTYDTKTNDAGFLRILGDGSIVVRTWPAKTANLRERSAKLARLGTGDCDRFLFGWGEMETNLYYPERYKVIELNGEGSATTAATDVTDVTQWAEETLWTTLSNGDVAWAHTWRRSEDGTPSKVSDNGGKTCSNDGGGYGYSWGTDAESPGRGFHTNEAFFMRYDAQEVDECEASPCTADQTCEDTSRFNSINDYVCSCVADPSVSSVAAPALCTIDECTIAPPPCADQTCADPDTSVASKDDYVCSCMDPTVHQTGSPAVCVVDECEVNPCGMDQTCSDPDTSPNSLNTFVCTCDNDPRTTNTAAPVVCDIDECAASPPPCAGQSCEDLNTRTKDTNDFVCTCMIGTGSATGLPAVCVLDECASNPCKTQDCTDPSPTANSTDDFICTCSLPFVGSNVGSEASCTLDECLTAPCGAGQNCSDTDISHTDNFICTCENGNTAVAKPAPDCIKDECIAALPRCGLWQTCHDPNTSYVSLQDYICTCEEDSHITNVDGPAKCSSDECKFSPCGDTQTCHDPDTREQSYKDFICTCPNGVTSTGSSASCIVDECLTLPCGAGQTCTDVDTRFTSRRDFVCQCLSGTKATGTPADCTPKGTNTPLSTETPETTAPIDPTLPNVPSTSVPLTEAPPITGRVVATADKASFNETKFRALVETLTGIAAEGIAVEVVDAGDGKVVVTTLLTGKRGEGGAKSLGYDLAYPVGGLAEMGMAAVEDEQRVEMAGGSGGGGGGVAWYIWVGCLSGALAFAVGMVVTVVTCTRVPKHTPVPFDDFIETEGCLVTQYQQSLSI